MLFTASCFSANKPNFDPLSYTKSFYQVSSLNAPGSYRKQAYNVCSLHLLNVSIEKGLQTISWAFHSYKHHVFWSLSFIYKTTDYTVSWTSIICFGHLHAFISQHFKCYRTPNLKMSGLAGDSHKVSEIMYMRVTDEDRKVIEHKWQVDRE